MSIEKAVKYSIDNILKEGLTDIFPQPFEVDLLKNNEFRKKISDHVIKALKGNSIESFAANWISHVLMPKNSAFDFRRCALIQPLDTIKYTALILLFAETIEKNRIPVSEKRIFSYRFKLNSGYIFNKNYTITSFNSYAREKSKKKNVKFIVTCDIANFYDRLNLHRLENQLLSMGCDKVHVKVLNDLLLFWSNKDSYGLPVGSNASRILAEASLAGVDTFLKEHNVDFIRFVDDYRFFAPNASTAHYWLTLLIERLWQEGLTINKSKTKIEASAEYKKREIKAQSTNKGDSENSNTMESERNPFKIRAGYGGTVPTKFRQLSSKEIEHFKEMDVNEKIVGLANKDFIEAEQIVETVKVIISTERYNEIEKVVKALDRYPQLTPYVIDALIKYSESINQETSESIKGYFKELIDSNKHIPEYIYLAIIRLFGSPNFVDVRVIMKLYRNLKRNSGAYIGRALLEALEKNASRNETNEIRTSFDRADAWEKRQIAKNVIYNLFEEEKKAWIRSIKSLEQNDLFLIETISPSKKNNINKKKKGKK